MQMYVYLYVYAYLFNVRALDPNFQKVLIRIQVPSPLIDQLPMVWCSVVWCVLLVISVVWCVAVWCIVWCSVVWCGRQ